MLDESLAPPSRSFRLLVLAVVASSLAWAAVQIFDQAARVAIEKHLFPKWDSSAHLLVGWTSYWYLIRLQLHKLFWHLWSQGLWPPVYAIWQIPFFLVLGPGIASSLVSSLTTFVLLGLAGSVILLDTWGRRAFLPVAVLVGFLLTSPFYLAYASIPMMEMIGALASGFVLLAYLRSWRHNSRGSARLFAISLSILFFTKYNYFLLTTIPLVIHEFIERTRGSSLQNRTRLIGAALRYVLSNRTTLFVVLYLIGLVVLIRSSGFEFRILGQRVTVYGIGATGHIVLYALLARMILLHRRGQIDWQRLINLDPRVRPLLLWFVLPLTVWLASPHPNHIRDFVALIVNSPMGEKSTLAAFGANAVGLGQYFRGPVELMFSAAITLLVMLRFSSRPAALRLFALLTVLQFVMVSLHHSRGERFLFITLVPFWLTVAGELGEWVASPLRRKIANVIAGVLLLLALAANGRVLQDDRFRRLAFDQYTESEELVRAFEAVRDDIGPDDYLAVQGKSNGISTSLVSWELGPPSGLARFPILISDQKLGKLDDATKVLLIVPTDLKLASPEIVQHYETHRAGLQMRSERFTLLHEYPIPTQHLAFQVYQANH